MKVLNYQILRPRSIVLTVLSIFLGSFFLLMGILKLGPWISSDIHRELRRNFIHFAKLIPLVRKFSFRVSPKWYRIIWGTLEVIGGFTLIFIPIPKAKLLANLILLLLALISILNNYRAGHRFDRIAPCIVFTLMLTCRLIVEYQVYRREQQQKFGSKKPKINSINNNNNNPVLNLHNNSIIREEEEEYDDDDEEDNVKEDNNSKPLHGPQYCPQAQPQQHPHLQIHTKFD